MRSVRLRRVTRVLGTSLLALCSAPALAKDVTMSLSVMHTDFGNAFGDRLISSVEVVTPVDDDVLTLALSAGTRAFSAGEGAHASAGSVTWHGTWGGRIFTRTRLTVGSDDPVFVHRLADQDVTIKLGRSYTATAGVKVAEYYGGADATSWYVAGTYYVGRGSVRYRYTHYDISGIGSSYGNMVAVRLNSDKGAVNQLWLGQGTSIQEYDWAPVAQGGDYLSAALKRTQPIGDKWLVSIAAERSLHDVPGLRYFSTSLSLGLSYQW